MSRKYIDDLNLGYTDQDLKGHPDDPRQEKWKQQVDTYGFNERETWDLDIAFYMWLYERLMMYKEVSDINTSFQKYKFQGVTITQEECIDRMVEGCKYAIISDRYEISEYERQCVNEVTKLWDLCIIDMWW